MSHSSNELNFLILRYLEDSGFVHSAFNFGHESGIVQSNFDGIQVPPSALISIVQKGVLYTEAERYTGENREERSTEGLSLIEAVTVAKNEIDSVQECVSTMKISVPPMQQTVGKSSSTSAETPTPLVSSFITTTVSSALAKLELNKATVSKDSNMPSKQKKLGDLSKGVKIPPTQVSLMHEYLYFTCAWNPCSDIFALHSRDSTICLWNFDDPSRSTTLRYSTVQDGQDVPSFKEIGSLDWNGDGSLLAAGCFDGFARIWRTSGQLVSTLRQPKGYFLELKLNKKGNYLLSAGSEKTAAIWDTSTGTCRQLFYDCDSDIDWQSNSVFAYNSKGNQIRVCKLGLNHTLRTFVDHTKMVNSIRWCPTGLFLASCSADMSVKVWTLQQGTPVHSFQGHTRDVITMDWSNTGQGTANPNMNLMLASGSADSTVRLWDVESGLSMHSPMRHPEDVRSVKFSPDGRFLASGCFGRNVKIWSNQSGQLVKRYKVSDSVAKVCWNAKGDKIGLAQCNGTVEVLDMRK